MKGVGHGRLGRIASFTAAVLLAQGCAGDDAETAADGPVAQGQALYEANCLACHGEGALGDGPMAGGLPVPPPSILEHLAHHTQAQLVQIIQDGLPPAMPPVALNEEEVQLVVDYVWTLVPESEVAALRAMQEHMEMMGDGGMTNMPGMSGMPGMGAAAGASPAADSAATATPGSGGQ